MAEIKETKIMSKEDFNNLLEDNTAVYEFIDGVMLMSPRPSFSHQNIMFNLIGTLFNYFKGKPCRAFSEVELEINEDVIVPDISVFCNMETTDIQRSKEPPMLVIEILSPSNTVYEMEDKKDKYKNHGINEYWTVNPKNKTIIQYDLQNETNMTYMGTTVFNSLSFKDLSITLSEVFV